MRTLATYGALIFLNALVLAGCAGGDGDALPAGEPAPNIVQPGAPGEGSRTLAPEELEDIRAPEYTDADVRFMQGMIHHHAQALRMTALVPDRSASDAIPLLAERMDLSQEAEIDLMREWLIARRQDAPEPHREHGHGHGPGRVLMPGMLTEDELRKLEAAEGAEFDRLFLEFMIRHHEGAIEMVETLYAEGGGQEPEVDAFARHVVADQQIEIERMRQLLAGR
jgi:uncharacterized protein (DUF305 family)